MSVLTDCRDIELVSFASKNPPEKNIERIVVFGGSSAVSHPASLRPDRAVQGAIGEPERVISAMGPSA